MYTAFPHTVSAETIQGRKLHEEIRILHYDPLMM